LEGRNSIVDSGLIFFSAVLWVSLLCLLQKVRGIRIGCDVWKEEECNNVILKKYSRETWKEEKEEAQKQGCTISGRLSPRHLCFVYFQVTTNKMQRFLIYLFQQMPPIIRSTELYIQLQVLSTNTAARC
jgi:hypothetical protein